MKTTQNTVDASRHISVSQKFRALDPDLPFVAANAAAELDNLLHEKEQELQYVSRLADLLSKATAAAKEQGVGKKALLDPVSLDVFNRAYLESYKTQLNTLEELSAKVSEVSKRLHDIKPQAAREFIETLRDFCVAISTYSLSSRKTRYGSSTNHPYRK